MFTGGRDFWLLAGLSLFIAAGLGFAAGYLSARLRDRSSYSRARRGINRLFETARQTLEAAQDVCGLLEKSSEPVFLPEEAEQLASRGKSLFESICRIVTLHRPETIATPAGAPAIDAKKAPVEQKRVAAKLEWKLDQLNPVTGLPDAAAFQSNLQHMLEHAQAAEISGGLLAIQIDKLSSLRTRFGAVGAETLLKKLAFIVCRSVRDQDLVCQLSADQIFVLLPDVDAESGAKLARSVKDAVRQHHFRIEEQGMEVLVTASFGYIACRPYDHAELLMDRATDALRSSQRLGRNQLHVHNGEEVLHCVAG